MIQSTDLWRCSLAQYAHRLSKGRWLPYKNLVRLAQIFQSAFTTPTKLIVNVPSRHGKTELLKWASTWFLDANPYKYIIYASYSDELSGDFGRVVRDRLDGSHTTVQVSSDSSSANRWHIMIERENVGGLYAVSLGGTITGRGFNVGIIDDPHKSWEDAHSAANRQRVKDWFDGTFLDRKEPNSSMIVIMTRWHPEDLTAHLLRKKGWKHINLQALAPVDDPFERKVGEALVPERYPEHILEEMREDMSERIWRAKYCGSPALPSGEIWKRHWFQYWDTLPSFERVVESWDCTNKLVKAPKRLSGSFAVGQRWGVVGQNKYLIDEVRGRWEWHEMVNQMERFSDPSVQQRLVENKSGGPGAVERLRERGIGGWILIDPESDKVLRAEQCQIELEGGNVFLPNPEIYPWVNDYLDEAGWFPSEPNDRVDCSAQFLTWSKESYDWTEPICGGGETPDWM